eukprot:PITA_34553
MASSGKIEIEKFNGQSFELWKLKMEDLVVDKDQWIAVDPGTKPTGVTDEEWKKLDRKAKSTIRLCVSDSVLLNVSGEATAKALWNKLGTLYQSKSLVNKLFLRKKLYNPRMKDGDSVIEHLNAFNTVVSQLLSVDIKSSDEDKCISLLCSLPDSWDSLVIAIGSNATALQFDEIVSALLTEEMRRKNMDNQNGDALSVRGRSQNRNKNKSSSGRSKSPGKPTKVVCWKCRKEGHLRRECKSKAPDKGKGSDDAPSTEAKTTSDEGDDRKARIIGRGEVKLKLQGGRVRTLPGVLHIPALARNLISISKLDDAGVKTAFEKDTCKMVRGALVLMWGVRIGTLDKLQGSTVVEGCNSSMVPENGAENLVVSREKTMLWHQRLGHIGEKVLQILHGKGMVEVPSLGKSVYYISFINDFSRNTWIYFLKKKSEVFDKFKEFKALVENQTEKKIKVLRTDNGGEFCSKEFEEFCKCGIARQKTTPYTPQQNGVTERMNKTLVERARSMLSGAELGQEFWAEAVDTACYLVNRSPSSALEDKTPQEVWTGKKPSLSHLRVFGCDAYVHVPKENRTKLDSKSEKCIFIGYKDGLKGYKLWNLVTRKVVYSRDVVFR